MPKNSIFWGQAAANNSNGFGAAAQNNNINWGWIHSRSYGHDETNLVGPEPSEPSFFDQFGTPAAAYSLRDLSGTNSAVIEVRRSSDNAVQDFTASEITNGSLAAWVGVGNDGFVRTFYDQAGANDATQTTAASQPLIVDAGVLVTENGLPAIDTNNAYLDTPTISSATVYQSLVYRSNLTISQEYIIYGDSGSTRFRLYNFRARIYIDNITYDSVLPNDGFGVQYLWSQTLNAGNLELYRNGTQSDFISGGSFTGVTGNYIVDNIGDPTSVRPTNGYFQELIIYDTDKSADRTSIETNVNDYYSIY